jgi:O-antigen ligase
MLKNEVEKTVSRLVTFGAPFVTLFIWTSGVTDPVNSTKLFVAGGLGVSLVGVFLLFGLRANLKNFRPFLIMNVLFIIAMLNAVISSHSPLTQNIFGSYGRNTGFLTYLLLGFMGLGVLHLASDLSFRRLIYGLQIAGLVNVIYCAWVLLFGDFVGWTNPYGDILGLFGNPDFISAFLGMFITTITVYIFDKTSSPKNKIIASVVALVSFYEIVKSHAIQGIVITGVGIGIVLFFAIRSKFMSKYVEATYILTSSAFAALAVMGALQKGPFSFIYKTSVSLRGAYWHAGLQMGLKHPLTGVGMDSYGDWYRRARSLNAATILPGPKTISNAAHNVFIDIFSYGGFPLIAAYLLIQLLVVRAGLKVISRRREFNPTFVAMISAWACYQLQSIISINQIGLALWGWILGGALIAYEFHTRTPKKLDESPRNLRSTKVHSNKIISSDLVAGVGIVVGLFVASPTLSADLKWKSALDSRDARRVEKALNPSFLNPSDSARYAQAISLLAGSNLNDIAYAVALNAVKFNKDSMDGWASLYSLPNSTPLEKELALQNMKRLDPLNPDVTTR